MGGGGGEEGREVEVCSAANWPIVLSNLSVYIDL